MSADPYPCVAIGDGDDDAEVVFLVQAGYHLDDAVATGAALERLGLRSRMVAPSPPADVLRRFRSSTLRHREIVRRARQLALPVGGAAAAPDLVDSTGLIVVRNDWGPSRRLVEIAQNRGRPVIGWVEGVQDFDDVDTGRARHAYHTVDEVLTLGDYDAELLRDRGVTATPVGTQRLWDRWRAAPTTATSPLVANVNFTYGVHTRARNAWLAGVIAAARQTGTPLEITRHPADRGIRGRRYDRGAPSDDVIVRAQRLITRFSTVVYDALALGVDVAYFNPHRELVATFSEPMGAFTPVSTTDELAGWLRTPYDGPDHVREVAAPFLRHHVALEGPAPSDLAAGRIAELVRPQR